MGTSHTKGVSLSCPLLCHFLLRGQSVTDRERKRHVERDKTRQGKINTTQRAQDNTTHNTTHKTRHLERQDIHTHNTHTPEARFDRLTLIVILILTPPPPFLETKTVRYGYAIDMEPMVVLSTWVRTSWALMRKVHILVTVRVRVTVRVTVRSW